MPTNIGILMAVLLVANARGGCGPDNTGTQTADAGTSVGVTAGKVAGTATDSRGQPLPGAEIDICNPVYFNSCVKGKTAPDGRYSIDLQPVNVWTASGSLTKTFNGKSYCFDLRPSSTNSFSSSDGAIRDFDWKVSGQRPDRSATDEAISYYGASVAVQVRDGIPVADYKYVEVTFAPQGALVDGSVGETLTAKVGDWKWWTIGNIPLARYTVTAAYAPPGAAKTALLVSLNSAFSSAQFAPSTTLDFDPAQGGTCGNPETAGILIALPQ
jgi:hypothetical protein